MLTKQAIEPSRLFLAKVNFLFPKLIPIKAAKISPIETKHNDKKNIQGKCIQNIAEKNKNDAPLKLYISCRLT